MSSGASAGDTPAVSVVIPTHDRARSCAAAVASALAQDPPPLEVIVCDDRSGDDTAAVVGALAEQDPRVRYLRRSDGLPGPGGTRNVAIGAAQGDLVAFLDDDDEWLPGKLARQLSALREHGGLVCTNAVRSSGGDYFPGAVDRPVERAELLAHNPVILSSMLVSRDALLRAGGFPARRWLTGIEDYALLLALSDAGVPVYSLGEPLVRYEDGGQQRLSGAVLRTQVAVARLALQRALRVPRDRALRRAALRHALTAADVAAGRAAARVRGRR